MPRSIIIFSIIVFIVAICVLEYCNKLLSSSNYYSLYPKSIHSSISRKHPLNPPEPIVLDAQNERTKIIHRQKWNSYVSSSHLADIGQIYQKCDEATKMIVGKILLNNITDSGEATVRFLANITLDQKITGGNVEVKKFENENYETSSISLCSPEGPFTCPSNNSFIRLEWKYNDTILNSITYQYLGRMLDSLNTTILCFDFKINNYIN
ncbi:unnamed protein product [Gordionus sp. m RMFG-2023]